MATLTASPLLLFLCLSLLCGASWGQETDPSPETDSAPATDQAPEIDPAPETNPASEADSAPASNPAPETDPAPETAPAPEGDTSPETNAVSETDPAPETDPDPETEVAPPRAPEITIHKIPFLPLTIPFPLPAFLIDLLTEVITLFNLESFITVQKMTRDLLTNHVSFLTSVFALFITAVLSVLAIGITTLSTGAAVAVVGRSLVTFFNAGFFEATDMLA